jgi:hypothetical protein
MSGWGWYPIGIDPPDVSEMRDRIAALEAALRKIHPDYIVTDPDGIQRCGWCGAEVVFDVCDDDCPFITLWASGAEGAGEGGE